MSILSLFTKSENESPASTEAPLIPRVPESASASPTDASATAPAAAADAPSEAESNVAFERSMRDMSEKLARLTSAMEASQKDRVGLDEKLKSMEDRTRKLASLTEVMSNPFNPFVGDVPPREEDAAAHRAAANLREIHPAPPPPRAAHPPPAAPLPSLAAALPLPSATALVLPAPAPLPANAAPRADEPRLTRVARDVDTSLLVLSWCEAMLHATSRDGLGELLQYYQEVGWLGDEARKTLEAYANGIASVPSSTGDWRANVDLHQRSLLFIERLRAASESAAR